MTTTKREVRELIKKYVLDCIDGSAYEVELKTDKEKLQFLKDTFDKESNHHSYRNTQERFINWVQGLPSVFNADFEDYKIIEVGKNWLIVDDKPSDKDAQRFINVYWALLYREYSALLKKHEILN